MFKTAKNLFSKKFQFKIGGKSGSNVMDEPAQTSSSQAAAKGVKKFNSNLPGTKTS